MEALFITQEYMRSNTSVHDNTDWEIIRPIVIVVQDQHLEEVLGTALYRDVKAKILADPTLAGYPNYLYIVKEYIQKMLLWYVLMELMPAMKFRYENKGIMVKNSDNSQPIDTKDMQFQMDRCRIKAEMYAEKLTRYLYYNNGLFPLYRTIVPEGMYPLKSNYSTGIYLEDRPYKTRKSQPSDNDQMEDFGY